MFIMASSYYTCVVPVGRPMRRCNWSFKSWAKRNHQSLRSYRARPLHQRSLPRLQPSLVCHHLLRHHAVLLASAELRSQLHPAVKAPSWAGCGVYVIRSHQVDVLSLKQSTYGGKMVTRLRGKRCWKNSRQQSGHGSFGMMFGNGFFSHHLFC